ncbi:hypothetical protein, conserved [Eimeria tenella]|uniref:Uncharacterized protein n=1 Tax=Eimeria tenella TaxID=5802 RepID=U6L1P7_EIMTE|nr:hypothetical protein, conserved [Eimeria tenella]CDJ43118.1 hypothetical protein, conserved [Eimeria tenella]|eukprot:XP_013233868.1 hypothetical protein, conserved [Eimeria tenella]
MQQRSLCPVILDVRRGTLGKILSPPPGRGQRLEETTDSKGIHSGGEVGALQIDVDASPQQETNQGEGRRPSQTSTAGLLAGTIPRRTQDRDQSRDFGRRRRTGMPPP